MLRYLYGAMYRLFICFKLPGMDLLPGIAQTYSLENTKIVCI